MYLYDTREIIKMHKVTSSQCWESEKYEYIMHGGFEQK